MNDNIKININDKEEVEDKKDITVDINTDDNLNNKYTLDSVRVSIINFIKALKASFLKFYSYIKDIFRKKKEIIIK